MISTVAVGTDGSATASAAIEEAAEIARRFDAKLVLLSAFNDSGGRAAGEDIELQWAANTSARVRSLLERLEAELGEAESIARPARTRGIPPRCSCGSPKSPVPICS